MTKAMAAIGRFHAGGLLGVAIAGVLGTTMLAGCATQQQQQASAEAVTPADEPENRRRARIRLELATGYYAEGKTNIALDELKQVVAADPSFAPAYNLRGLVYMRLGDNAQADANFRQALALSPRDADVLHNHGWLQCQMGRYPESMRSFEQALALPIYADRPKTLMAMGLCQARAGQRAEAERTLARAYELDAGNPITGYNLAQLLYARGDYSRAQFYIRRLNNTELANAESLWLGVKVEHRLNDTEAMNQLAEQLRKRYPQSRERLALDRRAFDE